MNIGRKIEDIRNKPEHIRERYVWVAVGICMLFILSIWLFSFRMVFKQKSEPDAAMPVKELMDKSKQSLGDLPSMDSALQGTVAPTE